MKRVAGMLAAAAIGVCAMPAAAHADDPVVAQAVAQLDDLGIGTLTNMPSGRTTYRTTDEFNAELDALAAAYPTQAVVTEAPYKSIQGRTIKYIEITNNAAAAGDGKPVFFNMGAIHGNESAAAEDSLEFAYDVLLQAKTNPKVDALLDKVRLIDMPLVNPDGHAVKTAAGAPAPRRASCGPASLIVPPATCTTTGVDLNRNYPFGWGSSIGVRVNARGTGPGSEPEVKNTMDVVLNNQVVTLVTQHTNSRAIFYPGVEILAGQTPDLNNGYRDLALAMGHATNDGYTNVRDSAHDYETSGETVDWSYYATRGFAVTFEVVGGSCSNSTDYPNRSGQSPSYVRCTTPDYTGTSHPTATPAMIANYGNHPVRNGLYQALVFAGVQSGHSVITGKATPGATLKITKDFTLYTNPVLQPTTPASTTPPLPIPTHLESSLVVPASGTFSWDVNPSIRPVPPYRAEGRVGGPNGYLNESWTITCTAPDGTLLETNQITVDKGQTVNMSLCTQGGVGGTVPATLALTLGGPASFGAFTPGIAKDYAATSMANVTSTAGDATLSVSDPGHLMNGAFSLPSPLQVLFSKSAWSAPVSNDPVTITFNQAIGANDALRTGSYSKTLTFTLSTTNP
jgi:hypothetical protein